MKTRPLFDRHVFLDKLPDIYQRENGNVGSLPKDILELIFSQKGSKGERIKKVQEIFCNANKILSEVELKKIEIADTINPKNIITPFLPKLAKVETQPNRISKIFNEIRKRLTPNTEYFTELTSKASKYIEEEFKALGILKPEETVRISYIQQGKFKNAFKFEMRDKNGRNIIHPKMLISFKDKNVANLQFNKIIELIKKYYTSIKPKQYLKIVDNLIKNASRKVVPEEEIELYKDVLTKLYASMKSNTGEEKFREILDKTILREIQFNGIGPESNITQFLKHACGSPMKDSNFVPFYWLNLKHNIAISEFSDEALGTPKHIIHLNKYGLYHDDLEWNKDNEVLGRVVDMGGIKPLKGYEELANNPIVRRYYHKFTQIRFNDKYKTFDARIKYWNALYEKAINRKIANNKEILKALQICKAKLPPEYHHKLLDSGSDAFI